jgi:DNA modification methylase
MKKAITSISDQRRYRVTTVSHAREIINGWLTEIDLINAVTLGLPEIDDRYHCWQVPLCSSDGTRVGEAVIDARTTEIDFSRTTKPKLIVSRLLKKRNAENPNSSKKKEYRLSTLRNTIGLGDSLKLVEEMPAESVDLIFTSPPYFNARPQYADYQEYDEYLFQMRQLIRRCHRVLSEGRFFVINVSAILVRRTSRGKSSRRIAVPFDIHQIFVTEGFDFIDDIIWMKPEGAGWATGRGRRFAADRNPLQYKAVPVTEYVLVYRKTTDLLIDWNIRHHPNKQLIEESKITGSYEKTNVWRISPRTNSSHPAAFPQELAEKVISYYSFKQDVVMDPFAGSGTVGSAASKLGRRFVLYDINKQYIDHIRNTISSWDNINVSNVMWVNCSAPSHNYQLFGDTNTVNED